MSSSSDESTTQSRSAKSIKISRSKDFNNWKIRTIANASASGLTKYLLTDQTVVTEDELDDLQAEWNAFNPRTEAQEYRIAQVEYKKAKKNREKWMKAIKLLTDSVTSNTLRKMNEVDSPKEKFDIICLKYGRSQQKDLGVLKRELENFKIASMKTDPDNYFAEMSELNDQIRLIDADEAKTTKALAIIATEGLHKKYKTVKTHLEMTNDDQNWDVVKSQVIDHWERNYNKKKVKMESDASDDSAEESSDDDIKKKKKRSDLALALTGKLADKRNERKCSHCGKSGHTVEYCWLKHGKPNTQVAREPTTYNNKGYSDKRECWNCGRTGHISKNCTEPKRAETSNATGDDNEAEQSINSLFIGTVGVLNCPTKDSNAPYWITCADCTHMGLCAKCGNIGDEFELCEEESFFKKNLEREPTLKRPREDSIAIVSNENYYTGGAWEDHQDSRTDGEQSYAKRRKWYAQGQATLVRRALSRNNRPTSNGSIEVEADLFSDVEDQHTDTLYSVDNYYGPGLKRGTSADELFCGTCGFGNHDSKNCKHVTSTNHDSYSEKTLSTNEAIEEMEVYETEGKEEFIPEPSLTSDSTMGNDSLRNPHGVDSVHLMEIEIPNLPPLEIPDDWEMPWIEDLSTQARMELNAPDDITTADDDSSGIDGWTVVPDTVPRDYFNDTTDDDMESSTSGESYTFVERKNDYHVGNIHTNIPTCESIFCTTNKRTKHDENLNKKGEENEIESWMADTGASCHVVRTDQALHFINKGKGDKVIVGDGTTHDVKATGTLVLKCTGCDTPMTLDDVKVVNNIEKNIISLGKLLQKGATLKGTNKNLQISQNGSTLTFKKEKEDNLYYMKARKIAPKTDQLHDIHNPKQGPTYKSILLNNKSSSNSTNKPEENEWTLVQKKKKKVNFKDNEEIKQEKENTPNKPKMNRMEAHEKWGHSCKDLLDKTARHHGIQLQGKLTHCSGCGAFKAKTKAITRTTEIKSTKPGERIYIDTTGPFPKSKGGHKYWMVAVDEFTDRTWTHFSASKKHMCTFVKEIIILLKGQRKELKYIRCDNAGEHQSALKDLCTINGITLEYTAPGTPQQNGRAERRIAVLWQKAMIMMAHAGLNKLNQSHLWAESVNTAGFLHNLMSTTKSLTPAMELWTNKKTTGWFTKLVQFGRLGYIPKQGKLKSKMKEKGELVMMLGYGAEHGKGTYRVYKFNTKRVVLSRDVI